MPYTKLDMINLTSIVYNDQQRLSRIADSCSNCSLFYMGIKLELFRPKTKSIMSIFIMCARSWMWKFKYLQDGTKGMQKTHCIQYGRGQDFCGPDFITVIALILSFMQLFTATFLALWKIILYSLTRYESAR